MTCMSLHTPFNRKRTYFETPRRFRRGNKPGTSTYIVVSAPPGWLRSLFHNPTFQPSKYSIIMRFFSIISALAATTLVQAAPLDSPAAKELGNILMPRATCSACNHQYRSKCPTNGNFGCSNDCTQIVSLFQTIVLYPLIAYCNCFGVDGVPGRQVGESEILPQHQELQMSCRRYSSNVRVIY